MQVESTVKHLRAAVGESSSLNSKYRYVQMVGLSLYTFPEEGMGGKQIYKGIDRSFNSSNSSANTNNTLDAERRVAYMRRMVNVAYSSNHWSRDRRVLKIFMAPEFFFRGPHGAYDMRLMDGCTRKDIRKGFCNTPVMKILKGLRYAVTRSRFRDWMFVFGTVVAVMDREKYYNFAPVLRGGKGRRHHYIIQKAHVSNIDFVDCENGVSEGSALCVANPRRDNVTKYAVFSSSQESLLKQIGFRIQDGNEFKMDGIRIGLEVCLDHAKKELLTTSQGVQVHLITSAGMQIQWSAVPSPDEEGTAYGPVFLQDGGAEGAHSQFLCPGCPYLGEGVTEVRGLARKTAASNPVMGEARTNLTLTGKRRVKTTARGLSKEGMRFFATEGSRVGEDKRFEVQKYNNIFACDGYMPRINIGPAFQIPSWTKQVAQMALGGEGKALALKQMMRKNTVVQKKMKAAFLRPTEIVDRILPSRRDITEEQGSVPSAYNFEAHL